MIKTTETVGRGIKTCGEHKAAVENRERMELSGVTEVMCFSDTAVVLTTNHGLLTVKGKSLKMSRLDTDTGELKINGEIDSLQYSKAKKRGHVFEGLLR